MKGEDAGGEGERLQEEGSLPRQPCLLWMDGGSVSCLVLALQCRLKIAPLGGVSRERMGTDNEQHNPPTQPSRM